ncbi:hypothetical protein HDV62DRAFT_361829 [Trichoderma sp. SZMC 28011]
MFESRPGAYRCVLLPSRSGSTAPVVSQPGGLSLCPSLSVSVSLYLLLPLPLPPLDDYLVPVLLASPRHHVIFSGSTVRAGRGASETERCLRHGRGKISNKKTKSRPDGERARRGRLVATNLALASLQVSSSTETLDRKANTLGNRACGITGLAWLHATHNTISGLLNGGSSKEGTS